MTGTEEKTNEQQAEQSQEMSKKALKKQQKAAEKAKKKAEYKAAKAAENPQQQETAEDEDHPFNKNFGDLPLINSSKKTGRKWTAVKDLTDDLVEKEVLIRARIHNSRVKGKLGFIVLRESVSTVQAVVCVDEEYVNKNMIKFINGIPKETIVDITALVTKAPEPILTCSQKAVELKVRTIFVVSRSQPNLPLLVEDAARPESDFEKEDCQYVRVNQDTRLDNRWLDLRTPANNAIFRLQSAVCELFREFLSKNGFFEIHSPKIIPAASEGGANVFKLGYFNRSAFLAQSPQLYKQMALCSDFDRVFEIGPVFRAEKSFTHRHLAEFVGLDMEMVFKEHYHEVLDVIGELFIYMFDNLNERYGHLLDTVNQQHPFQRITYCRPTLRLNYPDAVKMIRADGREMGDFDDLDTATERRLGELVKEKYDTDFFILDKFPRCVRPFYTMPDPEDERYSNSYDIFIRGEEIISGAQRIHDPEILLKNAEAHGIEIATIQDYINSFKYGAPPHAGMGAGLERVVMLLLNLPNVRKTSFMPRDPQRCSP